jgi:hypothetical protein
MFNKELLHFLLDRNILPTCRSKKQALTKLTIQVLFLT